jgi:hypothetical protein
MKNTIEMVVLCILIALAGISCKKSFTDEEYEKAYEIKMQFAEAILGKSDSLVGHAIIPFETGGAVDMYYFHHTLNGTGFATMELIEPDGSGPKPNRLGTYELVAFTKHVADTLQGSPYNKIERRLCGIFTVIGNYSKETKLEPGETAEIPADSGESIKCLLFDEWKKEGVEPQILEKQFGLLLCMEIHKTEMEYAMKNGGSALIEKLKEKGYYPFSDLDREPIF